MKKLLTNLWCAALVVTLTTACSNDKEEVKPVDQVQLAKAVSPDEALENLCATMQQILPRETRTGLDIADMQVFRNDEATRAGEATGEAYIINFKEGGYAILGGNTAQPAVLALIENGSMKPATLMADLKTVEAGQPANAVTVTNARIANSILETPVGTELEPRRPDVPGTITEIQDLLLTTTWGQGTPYNTNSETIALAQIFVHNAWRHGIQPRINGVKDRP